MRRREYAAVEYKLKEVDQAQRALMFRMIGMSGLAALAGFLMGLAADAKSPGPLPWALVLPVAFGVVAMVVIYMMVEGGGNFAATLHNPTGRSTPAEKQYSAAQALMMRGHHADAVAAYQQGIDADGSDPAPYLMIARIMRDHLGRHEDAAAWFGKVRGHPNVESGTAFLALRELVELYTHKLNQPRKALPLLAQLADSRPGTAEGDWATRELAELKAMVFEGHEE